MRKVLIMGSTGSIGTQALEIIRNNKDKFKAVGLTCRSRVDSLIEQIREFSPEAVSVGNAEDAARVQAEFPDITVYYGDAGLVEIAQMDCDIVLNSLMGISGLAPTYKAIECGRDIALANKETLVAGGALVTDLCRQNGVRLLPVDSEHSAIFQCLEGNGGSACGRAYREPDGGICRPVRRILLTASGGPFRGRSLEEMRDVTIEQALNHPARLAGTHLRVLEQVVNQLRRGDSAVARQSSIHLTLAFAVGKVTSPQYSLNIHDFVFFYSYLNIFYSYLIKFIPVLSCKYSHFPRNKAEEILFS